MTAMTISDTERREVARRLREMGEKLGRSTLLWYHIAKSLGVRTATDGKTACGMLADLIDPDCEEGRYSVARTVRPVDRDALLALADKVVADTEEDVRSEDLVPAWQAGEALRDVASKIREACGEAGA